MSTLYQTRQFLSGKILPLVKKRHQHLFNFGIQALTFQSFTSLNSNAGQLSPIAQLPSQKSLD